MGGTSATRPSHEVWGQSNWQQGMERTTPESAMARILGTLQLMAEPKPKVHFKSGQCKQMHAGTVAPASMELRRVKRNAEAEARATLEVGQEVIRGSSDMETWHMEQ